MKTVFDDTCYPSEIQQVDEKGQMRRRIAISDGTTASSKYKQAIIQGAEKSGSFKEIKEASFLCKTIDLFKTNKIIIEEIKKNGTK